MILFLYRPKSRFSLNIMKNLNFARNLRKISTMEFFIRKILMLVKIFENVDFGRNFEKKIDFGKAFRISQFWSRYRKFRFWSIFFLNHDFSQILEKFAS